MDPGTETDVVARARGYAREVHRDDVRNGTGQPYFDGHLEPVARIVAEAGGTDVQIAAAYLHDTAEDHGGERRLTDLSAEFGAEVAAIVRHLSDSLVDTTAGEEKAPWRVRKEQYLAALADEPVTSLQVAAADKLHNASAILRDHEAKGDGVWSRFTTASATDQLWYYRALADLIVERIPDWPPARELADVVDRLERRLRMSRSTAH